MSPNKNKPTYGLIFHFKHFVIKYYSQKEIKEHFIDFDAYI